MDEPRFLSGKLLLAMPGIGDPRFERAVIAVCSHDEHGALGIGVGHVAAQINLKALLKQFDVETDHLSDVPVYHGGPVEPQRGFVLHSRDWAGQGTIDVAGRWGMTGTTDVLRVIGTQQGPRRWLLSLGYAGWGAGQLDGEMKRHGWHTADGDDHLLFDVPVDQKWSASFAQQGIDSRLLASESGNA
ncbi:MAG: YqgE/AlgH family protein [Pseudomonadota bacterium]